MEFQDLPIKKKLIRFIFLISASVLFITFLTIFIYEFYSFRKKTVDRLTTIAELISVNSKDALALNKIQKTKEILYSLKSEKNIDAACLYDTNGRIITHYPSKLNISNFPTYQIAEGALFNQKQIDFFRPILYNNEKIATLYIKFSWSNLYSRLQTYAIIGMVVMILSYSFTHYFTIRLQESIIKPIINLAETAKIISHKSDYSIRATKLGEDELGQFTNAFNQMIEKIQKQNQTLNEFNSNLEQKIIERTVALENANLELKESEQQIQSIFNSAPDAVIVINGESVIEKWNQRAEKLFGWNTSEVIGNHIYEFIIPERYREAHKKGMTHYLATGMGPVLFKDIEIEATNKKGSEFNIQLRISPVHVKEKTLFIGFIRDITESKKAKEELQRSNERFLKIFENNTNGMAITEMETNRYQYVNDTFLSTFGYTKEEVIGKSSDELNMIDRESLEKALTLFKQNGFIKNMEAKVIKKNGEIFISDFSTQVIEIDGKKYALSSFIDVTERKKAEEKLKNSEFFLNTIIENIPTMLFVKEAKDLRFVRFNKAGEELLGYTKQELIGKSDFDFFPKNEAEFFVATDKKVFDSKQIFQIPEETIHTKYKGDRILETKKIPLFDQNGKPTYLLGISNDITEQKKIQIALKQKTEELERSNKELEQFAYIASHDLQEPLRMVNSYLQLLEKRYNDKLDKDAKEFISYAVDGSNRMRNLIFSLLDYSRVNRIKAFEDIHLNELLKEILKDLDSQIKENNATITIETLPNIFGDKVLIGQLFQNLISNAVKFKGDRNPEIFIAGKKNDGEYLFSVKDNGIGIQKEYADKLFIIFQRLNTKEKYPGTGIGLAICKKIVERHGGKIWFESEFGKGTTFYFTIKEKPIST